jgi:hypothetical protein
MPAWTSSTTDGGDLSVTSAAALVGSQGMQAVIDDTNLIYVTDDTPTAEPRYRARFYFHPNSLTTGNNTSHRLLVGYSGTTVVAMVEFRLSSGNYQLRVGLCNDATSYTYSAWTTISDASHYVEID